MAKLLVAAVATAVLTAPSASARPVADQAEGGRIVAVGGTPLTNGFFVPGAQLCNGTDCYSVPLQIEQGTDVRFINADSSTVANSHGIRSFKLRKKTRRPLFSTKLIDGPGETVMKTSHVKPGTYEYHCPVHGGMTGVLQVVSG